MGTQSSSMEAVLPVIAGRSPAAECCVRTIYLEHGPFIWRTLARLGVREADLDDALQEVLVVVHRKLGSFDPVRARQTTWLFGIALRVAKGFRRRAHNRREVLEGPADESVDDNTPEHEIDRARARSRLAAILDAMSPVKRATFVMFELEGLSCDEIANEMGVPVGTVHSRLHAARRDFEKALGRLRARRGRRD